VIDTLAACPSRRSGRGSTRTWLLPWSSIQGVGEYQTTNIRGGFVTVPSILYVDQLGRPREIALWRLAAQSFSRSGPRRAERRLRLLLGDREEPR
jgi:hypothetical protein